MTRGQLWVSLGATQQVAPRFFAFFLLRTRTGLRISEVLALRVEDVDFDGRAKRDGHFWVVKGIREPSTVPQTVPRTVDVKGSDLLEGVRACCKNQRCWPRERPC